MWWRYWMVAVHDSLSGTGHVVAVQDRWGGTGWWQYMTVGVVQDRWGGTGWWQYMTVGVVQGMWWRYRTGGAVLDGGHVEL